MLHELGKKYLIGMPGLCFQEPLSALWFVLCSLFFFNEPAYHVLQKSEHVYVPDHPSVLLLVSVRACKGSTTQRGEWFDCLSVWNKNIYIEKHGTNIQSDSCKLSLRSKRERHVYRINNSPDKKRQKEQKWLSKIVKRQKSRGENYCGFPNIL